MDTVQFRSIQRLGHSQSTRSDRKFPGGIGANHAVAVYRMSHPRPQTATSQGLDAKLPFEVSVSMIGKIGPDTNGETVKQALVDHQINVQGVTTAKGQITGTASIQLYEDGQSAVQNVQNANSELQPSDVEYFWPTPNTDLVVVSLEIPPKTASRAVALAREKKVPVILNLTPEPDPILLDDNELFRVDHLIMNYRDADNILELPLIDDYNRRKSSTVQKRYSDAASRFHGKGASCVVITLGEMGALVSFVIPENEDGAGSKRTWSFGAQRPIETQENAQRDETGASDAFVGAYAVEILRRLHNKIAISQSQAILNALEIGTKAGGYSVGVVGGMDGCPWRDQIVGGCAFAAVESSQGRRGGAR